MTRKIKTISLFSSAGIGELLIHNDLVDVVAANELIRKRANCYSHFFPETQMIVGDINNDMIKQEIINISNSNNIEMLIATPPCQGLSTLGKNKNQKHFEIDERNFLILQVLEIIDRSDFDYILIENVPRFLEMVFPYNGDYMLLTDILRLRYHTRYIIDDIILNAKDYGISQSRPRAIIKMFKPEKKWEWPLKEDEITLRQAIGHLPTLEAGETSNIPWHFSKKHNYRAVIALKHTETGKSAIANKIHYPKKADGTRIKGFHNTFKRMSWDEPCPTRTTYCGSISSHNNVHPGRKLSDGSYSDARVLSLLETFIVSSIPNDITFPEGMSDNFIRTMIGESIPPKLLYKVLETIRG